MDTSRWFDGRPWPKAGASLALLLALAGCGGGGDGSGAVEAAATATVAAASTAPTTAEAADAAGTGADADADDEADERLQAAQAVSWRETAQGRGGHRTPPVSVRLLGLNDFHGQLPAGRLVAGRPVGSAAVLKSWLDAAAQGWDDRLLIASAGDLVGASPLASALLRDEPTLSFFNSLGNRHCSRRLPYAGHCNLVATVGNHEFDKGRAELLRQLRGGNHADGPFLDDPWRGVNHAWVAANVLDTASGRPLLPSWTVKDLRYTDRHGKRRTLQVGVIGAVLRGTPSLVAAEGIAGLSFVDEAEAINRQVRTLRGRGVETIVVLLHQGGTQAGYQGPTDAARPTASGEVAGIVSRLDPAVDVVLSAHTHQFSNALLPNRAGRPVLVTQAYSAGTAYAEIDLKIDPRTRDVVEKSARIVTTYADTGPGLAPDAEALALTTRAEEAVAPLANRVVASYSGDITRAQTAAGESALGNLIADAQAATMGSHFAFMNPGGIRADLSCPAGPCEATYGALFSVQPFGNVLTRMTLTGTQIRRLLEQQWQASGVRFLQVSGLAYTWDASLVVGNSCNACVIEVRHAATGAPLDPAATYSVTVNSFLADGGDDFSVLLEGTDRVGGPLDLDGLIDWLPTQAQPVAVPAVGQRIVRID